MEIVYTKFSNDRGDKYAIVTKILKDEDGSLYIEKQEAKAAGKKHISNLSVWEKELKNKYAGTCLTPNRMVEVEGKSCFEYVKGTALDTILDDLLKKNQTDDLLQVLREYLHIITDANNAEVFRMTDRFKEVFGDCELSEDLKCGKITNIDMVTENIIVNHGDEGIGNISDIFNFPWQIIDYEWTFDFPIPVHFVIFRILHYFLETKSDRAILRNRDLYEEFGLSAKEIAVFYEMENHFQKYILGDKKPLWMMHTNLIKPEVNMETWAENRIRLQVLYDYGEGIDPKSCTEYHGIVNDEGFITIRVPVQGAKTVRLDPGDNPCITIMREAKGILETRGSYPLNCHTNAYMAHGGTFIFEERDPQIYFEVIREKTKEIEVTLSIIAEDSIGQIKKMAADFGFSKDRSYDELEYHYLTAMALKAEKEQQLLEMQKRAEAAEWKLHCIYKSIPYKLTKPFRMLYDELKFLLIGTPKRRVRFDTFKQILNGKGSEAGVYYKEQLTLRRMFHLQDIIKRLVMDEKLHAEAVETQRGKIKFSILVPVYNTPELYLMQMIESVLAQSYPNYQLCIADGSDKAHRYVGRICRGYADFDSRVCYKRLKNNRGIAENTNAAWDMADGNYIIPFDHDDILHPEALYEIYKTAKKTGSEYIYTDEMVFRNEYLTKYTYHLKPDFSPDYLRGLNYICHLSAFSAELAKKVGRFRPECEGSQDYDMALRLTEQANCVVHIPKVLYFWRSHSGSVASGIEAKAYCLNSAKKALQDHLDRMHMPGIVEDAEFASAYRIRYEIRNHPMISVLIPNKDHIDELSVCLDSIFGKSTYTNFEIVIIENGSVEAETFAYYEELRAKYGQQVRIATWTNGFNYAAINNFGAKQAKGEYLLLLNNDTEVITPDWLQEMLMFAQREDVGAVGPLMYYGDNTIQHAGVIIGIGGTAGHSHKGLSAVTKDGNINAGYLCKLVVAQNVYGVTGACMMIAKDKYEKLGGLDEAFVVAFNDVDFCCRLIKAGYRNIFTPFAKLYHYESKSRGYEDTPEKKKRFANETALLLERHGEEIKAGDPYYSPMLTLEEENYEVKKGFSVFLDE